MGLRAIRRAAAQAGGIVIAKPSYSAFYSTGLDSTLRSRGIRNVVYTAIATNVCVESTMRDDFFLKYFGVLLHDATHHAGRAFVQQATIFNVESFLGKVSTTADFYGSVLQSADAHAATP